jgi:hypothetical protein
MLKVTYEILIENVIDGLTSEVNEVLVDGLTFDEAVEMCAVYQDFFGNSVCVAMRETTIKETKITNPAHEYKSAYMDYMAECINMGNIL